MRLCCLLLLLLSWGYARPSTVDSLWRVIETTRIDTVRGRALCRLCDELVRSVVPDSALRLGHQGLELVQRHNDTWGAALCLNRLGNLWFTLGDYAQAQNLYKQSHDLYRQAGDLSGQATVLNNLGFAFRNGGDYAASEAAFNQSLQLARQAGNCAAQAQAYYSLATLSQQRGDYAAAETYFRQSLQIARRLDDRRREASCLQGLGNLANLQGDYARALDYYRRSLRLCENLGDREGVANRLLNLGALYFLQEDYDRAYDCYRRSLDLREKTNAQHNLIPNLLGLGNVHNQRKEFDQALAYYNRALALAEAAGDSLSVAYILGNVGLIYDARRQHEQAGALFRRSLRLSEALDDREGMAIALGNLAANANYCRRYTEARALARRSLELAQSLNHLQTKQQASKYLYYADSALGNWKGAFEAHQLYKLYSDSLKNDAQSRALGRLESRYEYEKQAEIDRLRAQEAQRYERQRFTWVLGSAAGGIVLLLIIALTLYRSRQKEKHANAKLRALNDEINQQAFEIIAVNSELQATLTELYAQRAQLEAQHVQIQDSIRYASRIQAAILPTPHQLAAVLPAHFILYQPRDIVSGDFYWIGQRNGKTFLAVVDCTGHGVPGAFMSLLGANLLHQIIEEKGFDKPAAILTQLDLRISAMLRQQAGSDTHDGMDVALLVLAEPDSMGRRAVEFAGAGRPLWHLQAAQIAEYKTTRYACGGGQHSYKSYQALCFDVQPGERLYLFSDGITDQFGGPHGRKLGSPALRAFLVQTAHLPIDQQGAALNDFFVNWRGNRRQLDDVLVVGLAL